LEVEPECAPVKQLADFREKLELRRLGFRYGDDEVLKGLDLTVAYGEVLVLIGASGEGKTTLLDLISGLLSPSEGAITVDRVVLQRSLIPLWREQIAYVPQESVLFDGTVKENLLWGARRIENQELESVMERLKLSDVWRRGDGQGSFRVGVRGERLSVGERQRLSIARAVLRKPRLLLLDEVTSALDQDTELAVLKALRDLGCTIILVTHRQAASQFADRVVILNNGRLEEVHSRRVAFS
jgi:ABC-type multidrug transport system fused ATPase/permease subunit